MDRKPASLSNQAAAEPRYVVEPAIVGGDIHDVVDTQWGDRVVPFGGPVQRTVVGAEAAEKVAADLNGVVA